MQHIILVFTPTVNNFKGKFISKIGINNIPYIY